MILVTGAAGKTGRAVVRRLAGSGHAVRAWVRRSEQVDSLEQAGARDFVVGNMEAEDTFDKAVEGATAIYYVCPNMHPDEIALGEIAIRAARRAECERFVYHSVLHPQIEAMPHHWAKMRMEERLFESDLRYTILQPAAYMQNLLAGWSVIVDHGVFEVPYSSEARFSLVDLDDVAQAAAIVLTTSGHAGATYELCGPDVLSSRDGAAVLEGQLGRPVRARALDLETWRDGARASGLDGYPLDTLLKMFRYYDRHGLWGSSRALGGLLGRVPTSFEAFVRRQL